MNSIDPRIPLTDAQIRARFRALVPNVDVTSIGLVHIASLDAMHRAKPGTYDNGIVIIDTDTAVVREGVRHTPCNPPMTVIAIQFGAVILVASCLDDDVAHAPYLH